MPTKASTLVEEEAPIVESTLAPVEEDNAVQEEIQPQEDAVALLTQQIRILEDRVVRAETLLSQLASIAHSEHHMELGAQEMAAIAEALKPRMTSHTQQVLFDALKEHYGMAPPAIRGDA